MAFGMNSAHHFKKHSLYKKRPIGPKLEHQTLSLQKDMAAEWCAPAVAASWPVPCQAQDLGVQGLGFGDLGFRV